MNLAATIEIYGYGTSEGVRKEWESRIRKGASTHLNNLIQDFSKANEGFFEDVSPYELGDTREKYIANAVRELKESLADEGHHNVPVEALQDTAERMYGIHVEKNGEPIAQVAKQLSGDLQGEAKDAANAMMHAGWRKDDGGFGEFLAGVENESQSRDSVKRELDKWLEPETKLSPEVKSDLTDWLWKTAKASEPMGKQ